VETFAECSPEQIWPSGLSNFTPLATRSREWPEPENSLPHFVGEVDTARVHSVPAPDHRTWFVGLFFQDDGGQQSADAEISVCDTNSIARRSMFERAPTFSTLPRPIRCATARCNRIQRSIASTSRGSTRAFMKANRAILLRLRIRVDPANSPGSGCTRRLRDLLHRRRVRRRVLDSPQLGSGRVASWTRMTSLTPAFRLAQGFPLFPWKAGRCVWAVPSDNCPAGSEVLLPKPSRGLCATVQFGHSESPRAESVGNRLPGQRREKNPHSVRLQ